MRSTLVFGCSSINISIQNMKKLDRQQAKLIKCTLNLNPRRTHTTALLEAIKIPPISKTINIQSLELLRQCLFDDSCCKDFYTYILNENLSLINNTLMGRVLNYTSRKNVNLLKYVFNDCYRRMAKQKLSSHVKNGQNGLVDTIRYLLSDYKKQNKQILAGLLYVF